MQQFQCTWVLLLNESPLNNGKIVAGARVRLRVERLSLPLVATGSQLKQEIQNLCCCCVAGQQMLM